VHLFELFSDPDAVATKIVKFLGADTDPNATQQLDPVDLPSPAGG
jgi:hypothetical protein